MTSNSHTFVFILVLRGYHVFNKVWKPALNGKLDCYHKFENNCDLFNQNGDAVHHLSLQLGMRELAHFRLVLMKKNVKRLSVKSTKK